MTIYSQATFMISAASSKQFPLDQGIEVAFAGRSNSGKSSCLNALAKPQKIAKTSKTPGRTQQINFFSLETQRRLVDLPGYGYAKVPPELQEQWRGLIEGYLMNRESLKGLILLMDIRHPLKPTDIQLIEYAESRALPLHVLLSKADKLSRQQAQQTLKQVQSDLSSFSTVSLQLFSALKKQGVDELTKLINLWLGF